MRRAGIALGLGLLTAYVFLCIEDKIHSILLRSRWGTLTVSQGHIETPKPFVRFATTTNPVPPPADHPPLVIVAGRDLWIVVYVTHDYLDGNRCLAFTDIEKKRIVLDRQRGAVGVREDVLHELMHVAWFLSSENTRSSYGPPDGGDDQDKVIGPVAPKLLDILADNPKLLAWLVKAGG